MSHTFAKTSLLIVSDVWNIEWKNKLTTKTRFNIDLPDSDCPCHGEKLNGGGMMLQPGNMGSYRDSQYCQPAS